MAFIRFKIVREFQSLVHLKWMIAKLFGAYNVYGDVVQYDSWHGEFQISYSYRIGQFNSHRIGITRKRGQPSVWRSIDT